MSCPGLSPEDYALYVIGLAETAETDMIRAHLQQGCESCIAELRKSVEFWYYFAVAGAEDSTAEPPSELRAEVLGSVAGSRPRPRWRRRAWQWSWPKPVAAAAALVIASVVSWYVGQRDLLNRPQSPSIVVAPPSSSAPAQAELDTLRARLSTAEQSLEARGRPTTVEPAPALPADGAALKQALAEAQRALLEAQESLAAEQKRAAALDSELHTQRIQLADAVRERQFSENNARDLAADSQSQSEERGRQIRTLSDRVQQLERENTEFRNVIDRQRRDLEQGLQFASFLSSPRLRTVKLQPTEKGASAVGYALVDDSRVLFYASSLPALPFGRTYQLWLLRGRAPAIVSGGLFSAAGTQRAIVEFRDPQLVSQITALAVTEEPVNGSRLPTGHKILIGTPRS